MILASTSRKAAPEQRALARGFAFAVSGRYVARGKTGLRELVTLDRTIVLFILESDGLRFRLFEEGRPIVSFRVVAYEERIREGPIRRGLRASEAVGHVLGPHLPTATLDNGWDLEFDGPQRLQYRLRVERDEVADGDTA
jgi:U3 small nucleolar ribonucleoprotein protein IMP4